MNVGAIVAITYGVMFCLMMATFLVRHRSTLNDDGSTFFMCVGAGVVWFVSFPYLLILGITVLVEWAHESIEEQRRDKEIKQVATFRCVYCSKDNDVKSVYCNFCGQKLIKSV
jgi:hypothetical protein